MLIHKALIKYGYSIFKLEILEYCVPTLAVQREQYYLDLLQPEYNTLKIAGSSLGFKHSELTMAKFRNRVLTSEQKDRLKKHLASHNASIEQIDKSRERLLELNVLKGISVEVFDMETSETSVYLSTRQAAEAIGCVHRTIALANKAFREKGVYRPIKGRYVVKIIEANNSVKGETLSPSSPPSEVMPPYSSPASPSKADVLSKDITPQTIASVIMGDGYFADGCVKICTDNFTEQEVLDLIQVLFNKFAVKATANKRTNSNGKVL
jgi:group I intron endonuclease